MKHLISLLVVLPLVFVGCGREHPSDREQIEGKLKQEPFYKALDQTPRNRIPSATKGDTSIPCGGWRNVRKAEVTYDIIVNAPNAQVPIDMKWPDTLVIVYTDLPDTTIRDTVVKPAPYFAGKITFYYVHDGNEWKLDKITPIGVKSDSAHPYVKIDSIQIEVLGQGYLPTIKDPTAPIKVENYPYIFNVGDSVRVRVYESGTAASKWVFLHAPVRDNVSSFTYDTVGGYWVGTWVPKSAGTHWGWVDVWDIDVILKKHVKTERDELCGIPYKVQ